MAKEKVDLRVFKTRAAIKKAFIFLVETKGYQRVTIQNIADEAMINRNTFYLHYLDKPDLMECLCKESIDRLDVCINLEVQKKQEMNIALFEMILFNTFDVIKMDIDFFKAMLSDGGYPNFANYLKESLKKIMIVGLQYSEFKLNMNIALEYMVSGLVGVICMWVMDSGTQEIDEVVHQLSEIHFYNVLKLLGES